MSRYINLIDSCIQKTTNTASEDISTKCLAFDKKIVNVIIGHNITNSSIVYTLFLLLIQFNQHYECIVLYANKLTTDKTFH